MTLDENLNVKGVSEDENLDAKGVSEIWRRNINNRWIQGHIEIILFWASF